jgi:hypothetical protein
MSRRPTELYLTNSGASVPGMGDVCNSRAACIMANSQYVAASSNRAELGRGDSILATSTRSPGCEVHVRMLRRLESKPPFETPKCERPPRRQR